ncbi:MAG: PhzF family phenazine biosynthesis protein [Pseudomonadota bacterium]
MKSCSFETYDVFTDEKFAGNPLAVVMGAQGLTTDEMQTITREFNLSETTFVLPPEDDANTARVRIFTLGYEMPFAGHPTVGTAIAIARARSLSGDIRLELNAGVFPVTVETQGETGHATFESPNPPKETGSAPSAAQIEAALSLSPGSIETGDRQPRSVGAGGVTFLYAETSLANIASARLDYAAFDRLGIDDAVGVYLFAKGGERTGSNWHARMFAPNAGIPEDPATGSAACSLPGQLALSGMAGDGDHRWVVEQGFEMGRPSLIEVTATIESGAVKKVLIGGRAILVQRGELLL